MHSRSTHSCVPSHRFSLESNCTPQTKVFLPLPSQYILESSNSLVVLCLGDPKKWLYSMLVERNLFGNRCCQGPCKDGASKQTHLAPHAQSALSRMPEDREERESFFTQIRVQKLRSQARRRTSLVGWRKEWSGITSAHKPPTPSAYPSKFNISFMYSAVL